MTLYQKTILQLTSSFASSINPTTPVGIEWNSEISIGNYADTDYDFYEIPDANPSRIVFKEENLYRVKIHLSYDSTVARQNPRIRVRKNGTDYLPGEAMGGYMRRASGHNEASDSLEILVPANVDDYIEVMCDVAGASGTVTLRANQSVLIIERV